jgi:uncharacterized protein (DUF2062 family)
MLNNKPRKLSLQRFFKLFFIKLFRTNDSPQKIAVGLSLGVFSGILPGTGPLAALFLAALFKVNKASALFGSLLTNTWLSVIIFMFSVKAGAGLMGLDWQVVSQSWKVLVGNLRLLDLFKLSILKGMLPVMLGYLLLAFFSGLLAYFTALPILSWIKHKKLKKG